MKNIIILFILFLIFNICYANEINEYNLELIAELKIGDSEGEIGWDSELAQFRGIGRQFFTITNNNLIYLCDSFNSRLNVYDTNFNFKRSISVKYGISGAYRLVIKNENIISLSSPSGLVKVNKTGDLIFQVKYQELPSKMKGKRDFFVFDDDVLYFDNNENLITIDSEGKIKNDLNIEQALEKYNKNTRGSNDEELLLKEDSIKELNEFVKDKKLLKIDGVIYTGHFEKLKEYKDKIKDLKKSNVIDNSLSMLNNIYEGTLYLIGYDNDGNSYWEGEAKQKSNITGHNMLIVLVCSSQGSILDCLHNSIEKSSLAIAPNGDVYIRENLPKDGKFNFYKIPRQW